MHRVLSLLSSENSSSGKEHMAVHFAHAGAPPRTEDPSRAKKFIYADIASFTSGKRFRNTKHWRFSMYFQGLCFWSENPDMGNSAERPGRLSLVSIGNSSSEEDPLAVYIVYAGTPPIRSKDHDSPKNFYTAIARSFIAGKRCGEAKPWRFAKDSPDLCSWNEKYS